MFLKALWIPLWPILLRRNSNLLSFLDFTSSFLLGRFFIFWKTLLIIPMLLNIRVLKTFEDILIILELFLNFHIIFLRPSYEFLFIEPLSDRIALFRFSLLSFSDILIYWTLTPHFKKLIFSIYSIFCPILFNDLIINNYYL